jgi:hypothetical protein
MEGQQQRLAQQDTALAGFRLFHIDMSCQSFSEF